MTRGEAGRALVHKPFGASHTGLQAPARRLAFVPAEAQRRAFVVLDVLAQALALALAGVALLPRALAGCDPGGQLPGNLHRLRLARRR
eukprot:5723385-Heterocapsa_arctica.AAC.1